jgi:hypothetical protein
VKSLPSKFKLKTIILDLKRALLNKRRRMGAPLTKIITK